MSELLTSAQMRAIEQAAFDEGAVSGLTLMERAGNGVVEAVLDAWPDLASGQPTAHVFCGPGNNGGDGFVIARLLNERGWSVHVILFGDAGRLKGDALENYRRWTDRGEVAEFDNWDPAARPVADLVVDALFGTGLTRPLPSDVVAMLDAYQHHGGVRMVAVDAPSGLCMDSGRELISGQPTELTIPQFDLTVSFHALKLGHVLDGGPAKCGRTRVADIGLRRTEAETLHPDLHAVLGDVARLAAPNPKALVKGTEGCGGAHKYDYGHAVVMCGGSGRTGAARLAARAALRIGAGLVTVAAPGASMLECASHLTAIMLRRCDGADGLEALLEDDRLNALCIGPGLGLGTNCRDLALAALSSSRPCVIDADALTVFSDHPEHLFDALHTNAVLTPHAGEFARLFPDLAQKLREPATDGPAYSKVDATREAAGRAGAIVLFKGPDTVIASPDGQAIVSAAVGDNAAPWLATAGAGDVLAGFIVGLMARGLSPLEAAENAAWLHIAAARRFGPGLIAEDLPEALPAVFRDLFG